MPTLVKDRVGPLSGRPSRGAYPGAQYYATDIPAVFEWNGAAWLTVDPANGAQVGWVQLESNSGFTNQANYDAVASLVLSLPQIDAPIILEWDVAVLPVTTTSAIQVAVFSDGNFNSLAARGFRQVNSVAAAETNGRQVTGKWRVPANNPATTWQVGARIASGATNANVVANALAICTLEARVGL